MVSFAVANARIRKILEREPAPVIAFLLDEGWVVDDCGIFNSRYGNVLEGVRIARRELAGQKEVPVPAMGRVRL